MPPPIIFPCGGPGQPLCPPVQASPVNEQIYFPDIAIAQAWFLIDKTRRHELTKEFAPDEA
jgi:hypothetical protein